ncbi:LysM domain protein [Aspergillus luchuensis]|uniref:LysM domain protein n=1 Tax=Aspergillus kawachii TaxID=1069201 RepID=A0A146FY24_ASPKA|nr:LysM domain protein [Aspergillus luchuensis]
MRAVETRYTGLRPNFFARGMKNTQPTARPTKFTDMARFSWAYVTSRSTTINCQKIAWIESLSTTISTEPSVNGRSN